MACQSKGKKRGFYSDLLIGDSVSDYDNDTVVNEEVLSGSDVFEVERIVEKRVKTKVSTVKAAQQPAGSFPT